MVIEKHLVENQAVTAVAEEKAELVCRHHWVIEPANGPISWGECQICHEGKEFQNSITDADRDY
ncbi:uncharacterized protein METZ01_LOCUS18877 [marine metagenome]|uniref:Uncharacterized protein n=1 Tax=marine metagenome TaxID=408172 RepID=A0A381PKQ2_9ZZZZ|tara:strand:+ start:290 stop:481 length:192 start_codon:yes stop_codon:yes gene_type:complete